MPMTPDRLRAELIQMLGIPEKRVPLIPEARPYHGYKVALEWIHRHLGTPGSRGADVFGVVAAAGLAPIRVDPTLC